MERQTHQKILEGVDHLFASITEALQCSPKSYEEIMQFVGERVVEYGNKTLSSLLLDLIKKVAPVEGGNEGLKPELLAQYIAAIDTREKAEQVCLRYRNPIPKDSRRF